MLNLRCVCSADGNGFTKIYGSGFVWDRWYEFNGNLYVVSSNSGDSGILKLNADGNGFTQLYSNAVNYVLYPFGNDAYFVSTDTSKQLPLYKLGFVPAVYYQSGTVIKGYTLNSHGIVSFDNRITKKIFISKYVGSTIAYLVSVRKGLFFENSQINILHCKC
jgi:hypothetical protein